MTVNNAKDATCQSTAQIPLPEKMILSQADLTAFLQHPHFTLLWTFLERLARAVQGRAIPTAPPAIDATVAASSSCSISNRLVQLLDRVLEGTAVFPANDDQANGRFGHPAFRLLVDYIQTVRFVH
jgi:hypothetical protein